MIHRAIKDLSQLNDDELYQAISTGLKKIYEHCIELTESANLLAENKQYRAFKIIQAISQEEAAKYLTLIDVLRCPRKNNHDKKFFQQQLDKFNDHVSKGIYVELFNRTTDSYEYLYRFIEVQRNEFYFDGFDDGVDWKFKNSILSKREESLYVDYVRYDEGDNQWLSPKTPTVLDGDADEFESFLASFDPSSEKLFFTQPPIFEVIKALHNIGIENLATIREFSDFWRSFEFNEDSYCQCIKQANRECLIRLQKINLLGNATQDDCNLIIEKLPFPLYKLPMSEKREKNEEK
ncbi:MULTISPECIES: AbiV family abortive infection protein, partial [Methylobacter]